MSHTVCRIEAQGVEAFGYGPFGAVVVWVEESSATVKLEGDLIAPAASGEEMNADSVVSREGETVAVGEELDGGAVVPIGGEVIVR